jgi:hypothetical protein
MTLPNEAFEREAAMLIAFDAHYEQDWLEEADRLDLLKKIWAIIGTNEKELDEKYLDISHLLNTVADRICDRYAEEHFVEYLDRP